MEFTWFEVKSFWLVYGINEKIINMSVFLIDSTIYSLIAFA